MNLEEIEKITKGRKELDGITKDRETAIKELSGILDKIESTRSELQNLLENKEKILVGIEKDVIGRFSNIWQALDRAFLEINGLSGRVSDVFDRLIGVNDKMAEFVKKTVEKSNEILSQSDVLKNTWENSVKTIENRLDQTEKLLIKNSQFEKDLNKKEIEIKKKQKVADETLQKAEDLVLWHKTPGKKLTIK